MARQFASASTPANLVAGHNETHRSVVALESAVAHYDGAEWSTGGVEQVLASSYSSPTTLAQAVDLCNAAKALWNLHLGYHNSGSGKKIYAHKVVDAANVVTTADMSAGSVYEATILASLIALANEESTDYEAHRLETGGDYHATNDTVNVLGTTATLTTFNDVAERLNLLKALINDHMANLTYHGSATSTISAANAVSTDIDSMITLANAIRTAWGTHISSGAAHGGADGDDTANTISLGAVTYPAGLFTLAIELKADMNAHLGSTTYHQVADSTNTISASDPTTVASLITIAAEFFTDIDAHFRLAPVTQAFRSV